jgi:hypothetical protein
VHFLPKLYFLVFSLLLVCLPVVAQNTSAEITGTVTAQDQLPIAGAKVTVINVANGSEREVASDMRGHYVVPSLPVGQYRMRVEMADFRPETRSGIVLQVAEQGRVDFTLMLGDVHEEIIVLESNATLRTTSAEVGEVIENRRLVNLPLNGRRFTDLMLLSDNIVIEPKGTRGAALSNTGPTVAIAGQRGGHNMYFLDGVSITDQYFNNLGVSLSVDAIQEFNIQKSIYPAEYGAKASAAISAATKSGGNTVHGSAYEFFRNSALDARNYFNGSTKPPLHLNQFGGTIGGPIRKDKTFFFLSTEALRERRSLTGTFSMPPAAVRAGNVQN